MMAYAHAGRTAAGGDPDVRTEPRACLPDLVLTAIRATVRRFHDAQGFLLASALAFSFLVCLAPLALLFFSATGFLLASDQAAELVIRIATSLLPGYRSEILAVLDLLGRERRVTGAVGAVGLVMAATPLFTLTRTAVNATFQVRRDRGLVHGFAFDLFALGVVGLLAITLAGALLVLATGTRLAAELGIPAAFLSSRWVLAVAPLLLYLDLLGLLFFIYRTFPSAAVSNHAALVAAVVVTALWEGARRGFQAYLVDFGTYGRLYGSFGIVAATFAWIYYSAAIFVSGAALTATLTAHGQAPEPGEPPAAPAEPGPWSRLPTYLASGALGAVLVLFALQNEAPTTLRFFGWTFVDVPLAGVVLGALAAGAVATGLPMWIVLHAVRARLRAQVGGRTR